jgi:hypothetical protein
MSNILSKKSKFKLQVYELSDNKDILEYNACINRTFVIIYSEKDIIKPLNNNEKVSDRFIEKYEYRGFYNFIYNPDFDILIKKKVNLLLTTTEAGKEYYTYVDCKKRYILYFIFKRLWVQKEDNIRWLMNIIIIIISIAVSIATYLIESKEMLLLKLLQNGK